MRCTGGTRAHRPIACLALVAACAESTVDLDPGLGPGGSVVGPVEDLAGRASTPVDLVIILDATVSMGVESERIVRDIGALVDALPPDLDIRVGMDLNDANATARREQGRVTWAYRPEFPFATDVPTTRRACSAYPHLRGCLTGAEWIGSTPAAAEALRGVVDVGNCSTGHFDVSIDSLARVLDQAEDGGCNAGCSARERGASSSSSATAPTSRRAPVVRRLRRARLLPRRVRRA